ncbi:vitamin K epoxide reductase family protein [Halalkalicoccus paucihalophilus]|uniref:Vitamin K epoxide reductase family protein n=1 Tax=Halalkalicoccus paucihalophilus TaxID=1008153 RepID=A0A151A8I3_9EURY|nr:vitamin K epoxide reductase family protein [Halalkalicoccus paucihalophilus]KYH23945.1 vitamin K epoxide reductase family protein [Halalkalicoccus paucihalophilus]
MTENHTTRSSETDEQDHHDDSSNGEMQEPGKMMLNHPLKERWIQYGVISFGLWLLFSPFTLGYESTLLSVSDIVTGVVLIGLSTVTLVRENPWASYANAFVGLWLLMAPLVFHAPTAAGYLNDTLVGILVITFSIIIMMRMEMDGATVPPGWSYNPSTAAQRAPLIALGLFGFFVSRYMAAYQLGHIDFVWDPFFGDGTVQILDSRVSAAFPVSDAGLGAVAYAIEGLMGFMGDKSRWRTMPWMVSFFGIVVIPLGFVQVLLVIFQPLLVGTWCTLCLLSAFGMLWMISLTVDEVVAMMQLLKRRMSEGVGLWHAFWMGGNLSEEDAGLNGETRSERDRPAGMFWGVSIPWYLLGAMALGFWLMLSPAVFGTQGPLVNSSHLVGALIVSFTVIATGEPARAVRFLNLPLGVWVIAAPWVFGAPILVTANGALIGLLLILLSIPRGTIRDQYGEWWPRYIV